MPALRSAESGPRRSARGLSLGYNARMRIAALALICAPAVAVAEAPRLTLDQVIARAVASPKARMAAQDSAAAAARVDEADAARLPRFRATGFGTASPEVRCIDINCIETDPQNFAFRFDGVFISGQLEITQPLYTFGKIKHARAAARAGLEAQQALADEAVGDLAVDAARAYWGIKVARELGYMLDDGIDEIDKALAKINEDQGGDVTVQDRQRIAVLLAEAKVQRADARMAELQALAGLRALVGVADADIDNEELAAVDRVVPEAAVSDRRPQTTAARAGATAAHELAEFAQSQYFPDLALVGTGVYAKAQGVPDAPGVFANDPFNRMGAALVIGLQWQLEPWTTKARVARARAEADRAKAQAELAAIGASYDAQMALAEASTSRAKVDAAADGEKAGRAWLASVLQGEAVGAVEAKDLADAYLAWFQMRARWAQAVMQWNVAVIRVDRAAGKFAAPRK